MVIALKFPSLLQSEIKAKQSKLKKILETDVPSLPTPLPSPQPITLSCDLAPWGEATPTSRPQTRPFLYDKHLNSIVALHQDNITGLDCDVFVIPLSSCNQTMSGNETGEYFYSTVIILGIRSREGKHENMRG